jgi:hypothetical protein
LKLHSVFMIHYLHLPRTMQEVLHIDLPVLFIQCTSFGFKNLVMWMQRIMLQCCFYLILQEVCCLLCFRSYENKTGKNLSLWESIRPLIPCILEFALFIVWSQNSSYNILHRQPRLFYLAAGTIFSNIAVSIVYLLYRKNY